MTFARAIPILLAASALAAPASAKPADAPNPAFTPSDLFNLSVAADPQVSPDGRQVAYVRRSSDIMSDRLRSAIWLIDVASGEQRPLAAGPGAHSNPRWSPDGRRLAYVSTGEGGAAQLFVRWMGSGETVRVTGLPDSPSSIAWSPDSRRIAYVMAVPDEGPTLGKAPPKPEGADWAKPLEIIDKVTYRNDGAGYVEPGFDQVFMVDADGGAPRQLTFGAFHHGGPVEWTPDGRTILLSANRRADWEIEVLDSEIHALDVASGTMTALTRRKGPDQSPAVSPDGSMIAFLGYDDVGKGFDQTRLYVMRRDGSGLRELGGALDRGFDRVEWDSNGRSVLAGYEDNGAYKVARIALDGRVTTVATGLVDSGLGRPYVGGSWSVARDGTLAFTSGAFARRGPPTRRRAGRRRRW